MNQLKNLLGFGNTKLPSNIAIFNMQPAKYCESEKLGLCKLCHKCYAKKAENQYPDCLPYRLRQEIYWQNCDANKFVSDFLDTISRKKIKVTSLRISESGDFVTQLDVNKLSEIATKLKKYNIITYVYTARKDLDYSNTKNLIVNASDFLVPGVNNQFIGTKNAMLTFKELRKENLNIAVCLEIVANVIYARKLTIR